MQKPGKFFHNVKEIVFDAIRQEQLPWLFLASTHPSLLARRRANMIISRVRMVAGLSVFPLTVVESALFAVPVLSVQALVAAMQLDMLNWSSHMGARISA